MKNLTVLLAFAIALVSGLRAADTPTPAPAPVERLVVLGPSHVSSLFALGAGPLLVGRDQRSSVPAEALKVPDVGYISQISAEGVLSLRPTLVIASPEAKPEAALAQIRSAGVRVVELPEPSTPDQALENLGKLALLLKRETEAKPIVAAWSAQLETVRAKAVAAKKRPKVAVLLHHQGLGGVFTVCGTGTKAHSLLQLAGADNAFADVKVYGKVTAEGLLGAAPDRIIVLTDPSKSGLTGADLRAAVGLDKTPVPASVPCTGASLFEWLTFGPESGEAALSLSRLLHGE